MASIYTCIDVSQLIEWHKGTNEWRAPGPISKACVDASLIASHKEFVMTSPHILYGIRYKWIFLLYNMQDNGLTTALCERVNK